MSKCRVSPCWQYGNQLPKCTMLMLLPPCLLVSQRKVNALDNNVKLLLKARAFWENLSWQNCGYLFCLFTFDYAFHLTDLDQV